MAKEYPDDATSAAVIGCGPVGLMAILAAQAQGAQKARQLTYACLPAGLPDRPPARLPACLPARPPARPPARLPACLPACPPASSISLLPAVLLLAVRHPWYCVRIMSVRHFGDILPASLSICLPTCLSVYLFVGLSVSMWSVR